jgi:HEAT repeat protein
MSRRECSLHGDYTVKGQTANAAAIKHLIDDLASDDGVVRVKARCALISLGAAAIEPLAAALASSNQWVRWEAAKSLYEIGNPAATDALLGSLEDRMFDVRWLSAQGLIAIGNKAAIPILRALVDKPDSFWLREGAYHVLHDLAKGKLGDVLIPVLKALEDVDASVEVPLAAKTALIALERINLKQDI